MTAGPISSLHDAGSNANPSHDSPTAHRSWGNVPDDHRHRCRGSVHRPVHSPHQASVSVLGYKRLQGEPSNPVEGVWVGVEYLEGKYWLQLQLRSAVTAAANASEQSLSLHQILFIDT